jgi:hypothetical protein
MDDQKKNKVKQNHLKIRQWMKVGEMIEMWDPGYLASRPVAEVASTLSDVLGFRVTPTNLKTTANAFRITLRSKDEGKVPQATVSKALC